MQLKEKIGANKMLYGERIFRSLKLDVDDGEHLEKRQLNGKIATFLFHLK